MDNDEIRISDLLYTVFKHRKTILVLGLLGFFCGFVFSGVSFPVSYTHLTLPTT